MRYAHSRVRLSTCLFACTKRLFHLSQTQILNSKLTDNQNFVSPRNTCHPTGHYYLKHPTSKPTSKVTTSERPIIQVIAAKTTTTKSSQIHKKIKKVTARIETPTIKVVTNSSSSSSGQPRKKKLVRVIKRKKKPTPHPPNARASNLPPLSPPPASPIVRQPKPTPPGHATSLKQSIIATVPPRQPTFAPTPRKLPTPAITSEAPAAVVIEQPVAVPTTKAPPPPPPPPLISVAPSTIPPATTQIPTTISATAPKSTSIADLQQPTQPIMTVPPTPSTPFIIKPPTFPPLRPPPLTTITRSPDSAALSSGAQVVQQQLNASRLAAKTQNSTSLEPPPISREVIEWLARGRLREGKLSMELQTEAQTQRQSSMVLRQNEAARQMRLVDRLRNQLERQSSEDNLETRRVGADLRRHDFSSRRHKLPYEVLRTRVHDFQQLISVVRR